MKTLTASFVALVVSLLSFTDYVFVSTGTRSLSVGIFRLPSFVPLAVAIGFLLLGVVLLRKERKRYALWLSLAGLAMATLYFGVEPYLRSLNERRLARLVCQKLEINGVPTHSVRLTVSYSLPAYGRTDFIVRVAGKDVGFSVLGDPGYERVTAGSPSAKDMERDLSRDQKWLECRNPRYGGTFNPTRSV